MPKPGVPANRNHPWRAQKYPNGPATAKPDVQANPDAKALRTSARAFSEAVEKYLRGGTFSELRSALSDLVSTVDAVESKNKPPGA